MVVTYRNNRLVPAIIITLCVVLIFYLVDPSVENYGLSSAADDNGLSSAPPASPPPSSSYQDSIAQEKEFYEEQAKEYADASSTPAPSSGTKPKQQQQTPSYHNDDAALTDDDILLIVKTGGTSMWKRLLAHLPTTLSPARISPSHIAIYSDQAAAIGPFAVTDALANSSAAAKSSLEFDVYRQQAEYNAYNRYVEASGVAGDEWGPVGGWTVDKYKFLPLMDHAGRAWPEAKWYVYMEDDSYLFLPEVRRHLSRFDHLQPHYLGSYAAKSGFVFAHGGAGFALSRGAWEASFGAAGPNITEEYFDYTATHCCGDQVLGKALKDHGVSFGENGGDEGFTFGFNPVVHWVFAFSKSNWCKPLLSWHKVHSRDVAEYFAFEQTWDFSKPLLHRDFFANMILPRLNASVEWWENGAAAFEVSSGNQEWAPVPDKSAAGGSIDAEAWRDAWQSSEACAAACRGWEACMMWEYVEDLCKMDDNLRMGQGYAPGMTERKTSLMHTSGWIIDRVDEWVC